MDRSCWRWICCDLDTWPFPYIPPLLSAFFLCSGSFVACKEKVVFPEYSCFLSLRPGFFSLPHGLSGPGPLTTCERNVCEWRPHVLHTPSSCMKLPQLRDEALLNGLWEKRENRNVGQSSLDQNRTRGSWPWGREHLYGSCFNVERILKNSGVFRVKVRLSLMSSWSILGVFSGYKYKR